ncbi:MAG: glycosyltransferase [Ferruginibacter sp.]|nr:glycosyltransferase [Cytophagales bacterium]
MNPPLVSVICLGYNQARFLTEALQSVRAQTYSNLELIVVDDASTDHSAVLIEAFVNRHPATRFVKIPVNAGQCRAFNRGLALATGEFVIDLAADDVLLPDRVSRQVAAFESLGERYGVVYTNARRIDEESGDLGLFYPTAAARARLPTGDVYRAVLEKFFLCAPTMMIRKRVLDQLGGYDETLAYEDFDFWVRSSRHFRYHYLDEVLTARREVRNSHSRRFYAHKELSTLKVCEKAFRLNRDPAEHRALARCVRYHLRQAFLTENFALVDPYAALLAKLAPPDWATRLVVAAARRRVKVARYYQRYLRHRYGLEIRLEPGT